MSWSAGLIGALLVSAVCYLALAAVVATHRQVAGSRSLLVMLLSVAAWTDFYTLELVSTDLRAARWFSALKFIGVVALPPALWSFVRQYTGRGRIPPRVLALMCLEPALVLTVLAVPAAAPLFHYYPRDPPRTNLLDSPYPLAGPLFWPHALYTYALMLGAVSTLLARLARIAPPYRRQGWVLMVASVLPFVGNLLWNAGVFGHAAVDPTPFLFTITGFVLVWGFLQLRLLDLVPAVRGAVLEQMSDGVLVLDVYGRVVDANPAGAALLGVRRRALVGRVVTEFLPEAAGLLLSPPGRAGRAGARAGPRAGQGPADRGVEAVVRLDLPGGGSLERDVDITVTPATDVGGRRTAQLVVLRDITDLKEAERRLSELLAEQSRLSETLRASLRPALLPRVPGLRLAARSVPAGRGNVGGDFYDVHPAGPGRWAFVLGDVSGKGVHAAVVTALARYAVGTLSAQGWSPRRVLERLNQTLRDPDDPERYATAVYGVLSARAARYPEAGASSPEAGVPSPEAAGEGGFTLDLALGGHPAPLLRRRDGTVAEVGRHGTALGLLPEVEIHEERVHLERGDVLVAYTDGVTEARHGAEFFGERRLIQAVLGAGSTADDVADAVLSAVRAFAPDQDDVALLVLAVPLTGH